MFTHVEMNEDFFHNGMLLQSLLEATSNVDDPKTIYTPADIQHDIRKKYGVDLNYMKEWRAKEKALEILSGKPRDSYRKFPSYLYMVKHTNPRSVTRLEKTEDERFLYAYLVFTPQLKVVSLWLLMRPSSMLCLDMLLNW